MKKAKNIIESFSDSLKKYLDLKDFSIKQIVENHCELP